MTNYLSNIFFKCTYLLHQIASDITMSVIDVKVVVSEVICIADVMFNCISI